MFSVKLCKGLEWRLVAWLLTSLTHECVTRPQWVKFNNNIHTFLSHQNNAVLNRYYWSKQQWLMCFISDNDFYMVMWLPRRGHIIFYGEIIPAMSQVQYILSDIAQTHVPSKQWETTGTYSISQEICTRFCCALLCCGYAIVHNELTWIIYPYSSGLLCWHWGNR